MEVRLDDRRGFSALVRDVRAMKKRTRDISVATKAGADELQKVLDQTFTAGKSPDGQTWAALKPSTIARKGHSKPLLDSGRLRGSRKAKASKKGVTVDVEGNRARVAAILSSGRAGSPARPVLPRFTKGGPAHAAIRKTLTRIARFVLRGDRR